MAEAKAAGRDARGSVTYEARLLVSNADGDTVELAITCASAAEARAWVLGHATITKVVRKAVN